MSDSKIIKCRIKGQFKGTATLRVNDKKEIIEVIDIDDISDTSEVEIIY